MELQLVKAKYLFLIKHSIDVIHVFDVGHTASSAPL